jgi:transposase-like protein
MRGRQTETKALIVMAAEKDGKGIGSIRLRHIPDASASSLLPFVQDSIAPSSTVHIDGWLGYLPLKANGYPHRITYLNLKSRLLNCCRVFTRLSRS